MSSNQQIQSLVEGVDSIKLGSATINEKSQSLMKNEKIPFSLKYRGFIPMEKIKKTEEALPESLKLSENQTRKMKAAAPKI